MKQRDDMHDNKIRDSHGSWESASCERSGKPFKTQLHIDVIWAQLKRPVIHEYIYLVSVPLFQASAGAPGKRNDRSAQATFFPLHGLTYERSGSTSAYSCIHL